MKAQEILNAPDQPPLSDATVVWRYMGFDKFISLVGLEELYFSRLTNFQDKEEMMLPAFNELRKLEKWETNEGSAQTHAQMEQKCKEIAKDVHVSCWTEGGGESFAQWKIYGEAGVAIKSTVDRLKQSIQFRPVDPKVVFITRVNYANSVDNLDLHKLVRTKRKPYSFENEIRMYFDFKGAGQIRSRLGYKPIGRGLTVDLDILIESIYISPFAGSWMTQPVIRLLEKLGKKQLAGKVVGSDIRI